MSDTPQPSSEKEQLEKILIDLYETAVLHGEALANVALPTLNERITVLVSAKAAIQTLYISRHEAAAERERAYELCEYWRPVEACPDYEVSTIGRVRSSKGIHKLSDNGHGYKVVSLKGKNWFVHRLVAVAFLSKSEGLNVVNHKDTVKDNNCVNNLEWCTSKYNSQHAQYNGLLKNTAKLSYAQAQEIRSLKGAVRRIDLAQKYGVTPDTIRSIWRGDHYKYANDITGASTAPKSTGKLFAVKRARPPKMAIGTYPYRGSKLHLALAPDVGTYTLCDLVTDEAAEPFNLAMHGDASCKNCLDVAQQRGLLANQPQKEKP